MAFSKTRQKEREKARATASEGRQRESHLAKRDRRREREHAREGEREGERGTRERERERERAREGESHCSNYSSDMFRGWPLPYTNRALLAKLPYTHRALLQNDFGFDYGVPRKGWTTHIIRSHKNRALLQKRPIKTGLFCKRDLQKQGSFAKKPRIWGVCVV